MLIKQLYPQECRGCGENTPTLESYCSRCMEEINAEEGGALRPDFSTYLCITVMAVSALYLFAHVIVFWETR